MSDFGLDIVKIIEALLVLMGEKRQEIVAAEGAEEVKGEGDDAGVTGPSWFEVEAGLSSRPSRISTAIAACSSTTSPWSGWSM